MPFASGLELKTVCRRWQVVHPRGATCSVSTKVLVSANLLLMYDDLQIPQTAIVQTRLANVRQSVAAGVRLLCALTPRWLVTWQVSWALRARKSLVAIVLIVLQG